MSDCSAFLDRAQAFRCHCKVPNCIPCGCGDRELRLLGGNPGLIYYFFNHLYPTCCTPPPGTTTCFDYGAGYNWLSNLLPYVTDVEETGGNSPGSPDAIVVVPPIGVFRFSCPSGNYISCTPGYSLTYSGGFTFTAPDGTVWNFQGFERGTVPKGRFASMMTPGGLILQVTGYTEQGQITEVQATYVRGDETVVESYVINHETHQDGGERAVSVDRRRQTREGWQQMSPGGRDRDASADDASVGGHVFADQWETLETVYFTYYPGQVVGGSSSSSSSSSAAQSPIYQDFGNIKLITRQRTGCTNLEVVGYYRYYGTGDANGIEHGPKFVLGPEAYYRLAADPQVADPLLASEAKVAEYADEYREYGATGRVSRRLLAGGTLEYRYEYLDSSAADGYNQWRLKSTTYAPGGVTTIEYTNYVGQVLIRETTAGGDVSREYSQYDSNDNLIQQATSAAIASISHTTTPGGYPSVTLNANSGLIRLYEYYTSTTTSTGGTAVQGYKQYDKIKKGSGGAPILLRKYEYTEQNAPISSSSSSSSSSGGSSGTQTIYPLLRETAYRNEDSTGGIVTSYSYTWHSGMTQMQERTTTLPAVPGSQNGSGVSATRVERFDTFGNLVWLKDERGFITYNAYDVSTGNVTQTVQDADGAQLTLPSGWSTPAGGGKHLVTDYEYDDLDRLVQTLGPVHTVDVGGTATTVRTASWTVYQDDSYETWTAQGYTTGTSPDYTYTLVNPVSISKRNAAGTRRESIQATRASTSGALSASDSFPQSSYVRWTVTSEDSKIVGRLTAGRQYFLVPASGDGTSGTNYSETTYGYDSMGRQNMQKTPGGTITRTSFDPSGRAACIYVGTDDSGATDLDPTSGREPCSEASIPSSGSSSSSSSSASATNNMVLVTEYVYNAAAGCSGCGGGGSGQLAATVQHVDETAFRVTEYLYDWRNRQQYVLADADDQGRHTFTRTYFDNLDQPVKTERYHDVAGDGVDADSDPNPDDRLIARNEAFLDDRGRTYLTKTYAVDPATGAVGNALAGYTWYDAAGNPIKQQAPGSRAFTKTVYDSLGRAVKQYTGYDLSEPLPVAPGSSSSSSSSGGDSYTPATNVTGDTILQQSETDYDAAGNVILATVRRRFHNATGTGELTSPSGSQPKARVSYVALYADPIGRSIANANYGTNGGSSLSRGNTVPARSDTVLVSSTEYDSTGQAYKSIDPAGKEDRQFFDAAGRVTKTIQNYKDGTVNASYPDEDVTVEMAYTADGQLSTLTASNPTTGNQVTRYAYGTTLAESKVARSDLLRAEIYPDSDDTVSPLGNGNDGVYDRVEYRYNRQGERTEMKDQNGTVHAFVYDALGRQTQDRVTTLGTGIDGAIQRITSAYEVRGMVERVTSYRTSGSSSSSSSSSSGSDVVNEVKLAYNSFGQLVTDYQEHGGAVSTSTSPKVQYGYASGSAGTVRATSVTYPNGRVLNYSYGASSGANDALSRVGSLLDNDASTHLTDYSYLGLGGFVQADYTQPQIRFDLAFGAGGDPYDGLDRFDRVVDHLWRNYGSSTDAVRIKHGYDRSGNRLWREDPVASASSVNLDELYGYDGMYQLKSRQRGDINVGHTAISAKNFAEDWTLDMTGNWPAFKQDTDGNGTWDLNQSRTHDAANEITQIAGSSSHVAHDRAGNMTKTPKPDNWSAHYDLTFDAWNRLVKVMDGATTVATYAYDGRNFRVSKSVSGTTRHFYFSNSWQCLEERVGASTNRQYVWGLRYVDDLLLRDRDSDGSSGTGNLGLSGSGLEERLYCLQDANWNVVAISSTGGAIQERFCYDAYGRSTVLTGAFGSRATSSYDWEVRYAGRPLDKDTGFQNNCNRWGGLHLGRWLSRDPIGYRGGINLYEYVRNSPLMRTDPMGLYLWRDGTCCERRRVDWIIARANQALEQPVCIAWFRAHGYTGHVTTPMWNVRCHGRGKAPCWWNPAWTYPGMPIGLCENWLGDFGDVAWASMLIHELAHHFCPVFPPSAAEACAIDAQNACAIP